MSHRFWSTLVVLLSAWVMTHDAWAEITQIRVYEDPSAVMVIDEVIEQPFESMAATLARGYSQSAFWLKLTVAPDSHTRYLRIRPPYLDHVTLYRPNLDDGSGWVVVQNGDRVPMQDRRVWGVSLVFALPAAEQAQTIYLRLQTQSSSLMNVDLLSLQAFQQSEFHTMLLQLLAVAVMLGILIWAALDYSVNRQRIVGLFLLVQVTQIGYVLAIGGYLPLIFTTATTADQMTSLVVVLTVTVTLLFHRMLVADFKPSRLALHTLSALVALGAVSLLAVIAGQLQFGLPVASMLVLVLIPLLLWLAFTAKRNEIPGLLALRLTYVTLACVLFFVMAPIFGIWVSFDIYVWATTIQGLLTGLIMAAFLFKRSMVLQRQSVEDRLQIARVQEKLFSERQRADDQRQFLDMLAHELKTPHGVIQLTLDSVALAPMQQKRLHRSLDTMSAVIDRCRLSLQLDEGRLQANLESLDIGETVRDLVLTCQDPARIRLALEHSGNARTDRQLFLVILHNLLDNALKYSTPGSEIHIQTQAHRLSDTPGVCVVFENAVTRSPAQHSETLFEKYFRGANASGQTGSGLGLHLSRRLATIINGQLWAELSPSGIKLSLWIPN
jgi:signal transduction histidine kinase